jgi:hypothetical protein
MYQRQHFSAFKPSREEMKKLDILMGVALLDAQVGQRLIQHDESLLVTFGLSSGLRRRLLGIEATSLAEYAQALLFSWE